MGTPRLRMIATKKGQRRREERAYLNNMGVRTLSQSLPTIKGRKFPEPKAVSRHKVRGYIEIGREQVGTKTVMKEVTIPERWVAPKHWTETGHWEEARTTKVPAEEPVFGSKLNPVAKRQSTGGGKKASGRGATERFKLGGAAVKTQRFKRLQRRRHRK